MGCANDPVPGRTTFDLMWTAGAQGPSCSSESFVSGKPTEPRASKGEETDEAVEHLKKENICWHGKVILFPSY